MGPTSITINIDFASENAAAATRNNVSLNGDAPTPFSAGGVSSSASGQSAYALPTPFANAAQSLGQADSAAPPAPSPTFAPGGSMGSANNASLQGDVPTPFSAGGFSPASTGASALVVPTPFDSLPHGMGGAADQAPTPHSGAGGLADPMASGYSPGEDGASKKSKK